MVDLLAYSLYTLGAIFKGVDNKSVQSEKSSGGSKIVSDARYYGFAMRIVGDFGATIAVPAVLGAFVGIWLDKQFGTAPWLLVLALGLSFAFTAYMIQKKATEYGKKFEDLNKKI